MIVVDASVLGPALIGRGAAGDEARRRIDGEARHAPQLVDLEVAAQLRRAVSGGRASERAARRALVDLAEMALKRYPHLPLLPRIWRLRDNLTAYDAAYVALAEALDARLVTADARLARAPGVRCPVEVLEA